MVSAKLGVLYPDEWPFAAKEIGARNATIKYSYTVYDNTSAEATCGWWPTYDPDSETVVVRNPFAGRRAMVDGHEVSAEFIEMDAAVAAKILVLGEAPR